MEPRHSSSSRKAAAARTNGRKGGTKSPEVSRWNALRHSLNTTKLSILEGKHLPEYGECVALLTELVESLGPGPLLVEDRLIIDKYICDAWRLRRAFRRELSETEKPDGMLSPEMVNVLRYTAVAQRAFEKSYAQIKEIRKNRGVNVSRAAAAAIDADGNEEPAPEPRAAVSNTSTASVEPPRKPLVTPTGKRSQRSQARRRSLQHQLPLRCILTQTTTASLRTRSIRPRFPKRRNRHPGPRLQV